MQDRVGVPAFFEYSHDISFRSSRMHGQHLLLPRGAPTYDVTEYFTLQCVCVRRCHAVVDADLAHESHLIEACN